MSGLWNLRLKRLIFRVFVGGGSEFRGSGSSGLQAY